MNNKRGFTLIELLIVIVVVGILAGLAAVIINPNFQKNRSKEAVAFANLSKVCAALTACWSAQVQLDPSKCIPNTKVFTPSWVGTDSYFEGFGVDKPVTPSGWVYEVYSDGTKVNYARAKGPSALGSGDCELRCRLVTNYTDYEWFPLSGNFYKPGQVGGNNCKLY